MTPDITLNPHFIYPYLLLLIPLWLLAVFVYNRLMRFKHNKNRNWDGLVDKALQPFVISGYTTKNTKQRNRNRKITTGLITLAGSLILLALAGPSLHKRQVALYEDQQGLVIALDLSASMLAQDIQPSRLQRAKFAIIDLLKQRKSGYTALVVFAGDAFAVTPLTNDVETIFAQLTHMSPSIMPTQGSRLDKAIFHSTDLLANASYHTGKILVVTDGLSHLAESIDAAHLAHAKGYEVSALTIGTEAGASIPLDLNSGLNGGLNSGIESDVKSGVVSSDTQVLLNKDGDKVIATLNADNIDDLQAVVNAGKGILLESAADNSSIPTLVHRYKADKSIGVSTKSTMEFPINMGIWLLFPVVIIVLLLFHRGIIWVVCAIMLLPFLVLIPSQEVHAADSNWSWDSLWLNPQQRARKTLINPDKQNSQQPTQGQLDIQTIQEKQIFSDNYWQAATAYRAKNYQRATELYAKENSAEAWYNKGNALVKMDKLEAALVAYQTALKKQPEHKDARYNLNLVRKHQQERAIAARKDNKYSKDNKLLQSNEQNQAENEEQSKEKNREESREKNREQSAFDKQWLNSIPDDPSGLWRRKFLFQYKKQYQEKQPKLEKVEEQQW